MRLAEFAFITLWMALITWGWISTVWRNSAEKQYDRLPEWYRNTWPTRTRRAYVTWQKAVVSVLFAIGLVIYPLLALAFLKGWSAK